MKKIICGAILAAVIGAIQLAGAADRRYSSYPATTRCYSSSRILIYEVHGSYSGSKTITCDQLRRELQ